MKVLRKPRLNRTVVRVAVDTAANFSRLLALSDMATPFWRSPFSGRTFAPSRRVVNSRRVDLYTSAKPRQRHLTEQRRGDD